MADENVVYIGNKMVMSYVLSVVTQFNNANQVVVKARGKAISRAVDVVEIVRNRFMPEVKVKDIQIGTEEITGEEGTPIRLSTIEITLEK
jgi:DNA-binding protein